MTEMVGNIDDFIDMVFRMSEKIDGLKSHQKLQAEENKAIHAQLYEFQYELQQIKKLLKASV